MDIVTTSRGVIQAYQSGILEAGFHHKKREQIHFRFITDLLGESPGFTIISELIRRSQEVSMCVEVRTTDLSSGNFLIFVIVDNSELIFFIELRPEMNVDLKQETGFWTNNKVLIIAFNAFFETLYKDAVNFVLEN